MPTPTVRGAKPPPHWRLEAIAATERPRSLALGAGRSHARLHPGPRYVRPLGDRPRGRLAGATHERTRPDAVLGGHDACGLARTAAPSHTRIRAAIWLVPLAGGPPRKLHEGGSPVWLDDRRLVDLRRARRHVTARRRRHRGPLAAEARTSSTAELDSFGEERSAVVSPDGSLVAYTFAPRADLNRSEIRVVDVETGEVRARSSGTASTHDHSPRWSPDGVARRVRLRALRLVRAASGRRRRQRRAAAHARRRPTSPSTAGTRTAIGSSRFAAAAGSSTSSLVDAGTGEVDVLAPGGTWGDPHWTATGGVVATYEDQTTAPQLRIARPGSEPETVLAPTPLSVRAAPHVVPEVVDLRVVRRARDPRVPLPALEARQAIAPSPAVVYPHGGPLEAYGDYWDGHAQYLVDKGYAWLAPNYRGSTGYGRDFERLLHGQIGVVDTKDCLAAADYLRTLDWVDGERLAIFGASWGSFISLLAVTDDPEHRFRCAVCKFGDCDMFTSWSQGDRGGVLESLENFVGPPSGAREAYEAASAVRRLENVRVPILVAHGERDERVHPKQSEELVAELRRLGKTYEYVTYPTEGHGLLRAGPQHRLLPAPRALPRLVSALSPMDNRPHPSHWRTTARETREALRQCPRRPRWPCSPSSPLPQRRSDDEKVVAHGRTRRRTSTVRTHRRRARVLDYERLEPPVRDAHRQGRGRLRDDPRPRRVVGGLEDGKTWTYKLREGLEWSDGTPLTAEDVAYTINRSRDEEWLNYTATVGEHQRRRRPTRAPSSITSQGQRPEAPRSMDVYILPKHIYEKITTRRRSASTRRSTASARARSPSRSTKQGPVLVA